jgi:hypothetical protein
MAASIPGIVMAGASLYQAYKGSQRSGAEKQALAGQQAAGSQLLGQGQQLFGAGMPAMRSSLNYYQTLLSGNRAAMSQAVAGPTAQLTDLYRGAERNLEHKGVRGGARDLATAELGRDRTNQLAQLTTGVQPMAAGQLGALGSTATSQAGSATTGAGSMYSTILGQQFQNRQNTNGMWGGAMQDVGGAMFDIWKNKNIGGKK